MIRVIAALLALLAFCGNSCACEGDVQAWSARFIVLKTWRGHFDGGPWIAEVDRFNGEKHRLMQCLSDEAVARRIDAAQLLRWRGRPDDETSGHSLVWDSPAWVYHWRGTHDQLAFTLQDGRVVRADWRLALE